jgi:hypothetical protein
MSHQISPFHLAALLVAGTLCFDLAHAADPVPVAVAAFDNYDTAGETAESAAAHAARVEGFAGLVGENLRAGGSYRVVGLACADAPCSAGVTAPEELIAAARAAGARLLVYGGIHKMSTLVQMGKVQAVDLDTDTLLLDRSFSFRGDNDEAFRRAAEFITRYLDEIAGTL